MKKKRSQRCFGIKSMKEYLLPLGSKIWECKKKKKLFYILKHYFIYFTNIFYNSPYIPIFIFTYNLIK